MGTLSSEEDRRRWCFRTTRGREALAAAWLLHHDCPACTGEISDESEPLLTENALMELTLSVTSTWYNRTLPTDSPEWKALRQKILERDQYRCSFCGFRARKYMVVDHSNGRANDNREENLRVNCAMCDTIRHCGLGGVNEFIMLGEASMAQTAIVRATRAYVRKNRRIPKATMIDGGAQPVSGMVMAEYANMLLELRGRAVPERYARYRGFFTGKFRRWQLEWEIREAPPVDKTVTRQNR